MNPIAKAQKKPTAQQAIGLLMDHFGYVVLAFPQPQSWPFNGNAAIGCCVDNYMSARVDGKRFEVTSRTDWSDLDATARFLGVRNPITESEDVLFCRAVLVDCTEVEVVEVVRRKSLGLRRVR